MGTPAWDLKPWETLRERIAHGDRNSVAAVLAKLPPEETVRVLFRLSSEDQQALLALIPPEEAAELLHEFPDRHAADLIDHLDTEAAAHIVDELPSDDGADILGSLDRTSAEIILGSMNPAAASGVRELIDYPIDVAGGLMELEHFAYPETIRQRDFIHDVRARRQEIDQLPARLLLIDSRGQPSGAVHIADVLLANPDSPLGLRRSRYTRRLFRRTRNSRRCHRRRSRPAGRPGAPAGLSGGARGPRLERPAQGAGHCQR